LVAVNLRSAIPSIVQANKEIKLAGHEMLKLIPHQSRGFLSGPDIWAGRCDL
jgi:hypothetical protein